MTLLNPETIEWRRIPYLPGRYQVSNTGAIRMLPREITVVRKNGTVSIRHVAEKILVPYSRPTGKSKGHPVVSISYTPKDAAKIGEMRVCLMVARAFHGCPYEPGDGHGCQQWRIRHIDGDINNNRADNLEWIGNAGAGDQVAKELYLRNLTRLEELRKEPVEEWIKRIWGKDYATEVA